MKKIKTYAVYIVVTLIVGGLSAILTMESMKGYSSLAKPLLSPPAWLFPIVWSVLFVLMAIGGAKYNLSSNKVSYIFFLQLAVNFFWPIIFFNMNLYLFAFVWLILLLFLVVIMTVQFYRQEKWAGFIQIPYIVWLVFAGYLNFMVYLLNR